MSITLKLFIIVLLLIQLILIINIVKIKKISIKYASFWISLVFMMFIVVIFPDFIFCLSDLFGFESSSNMIFLLGFFFLFYTMFIITIWISIQNTKIKLLIQELSMLKESVSDNGKKE